MAVEARKDRAPPAQPVRPKPRTPSPAPWVFQAATVTGPGAAPELSLSHALRASPVLLLLSAPLCALSIHESQQGRVGAGMAPGASHGCSVDSRWLVACLLLSTQEDVRKHPSCWGSEPPPGPSPYCRGKASAAPSSDVSLNELTPLHAESVSPSVACRGQLHWRPDAS